jgi:hypothetical protein
MQPQKHTSWSATAAIAAALALSATPLAAQDAAPVTEPPAIQPVEPAPTVVASPAPTVDIPDVTAPAASGAGAAEPAPEPSATVTTTTTRTTAPVTRTTSRTTVSRKVSQTAPAVVAPVAAVPPPANDVAPLPTEAIDAAPVAALPVPAPQPAPAPSNDAVGTLGFVLLGLLALAALAAGMLFFRRRHPVVTETVEDPLAARTVAAPPVAEPPVAEPIVATPTMAAPTMLHRRDPNPVTGALPSEGAAVDLPARLPESYEERNALFERMVNARPDKANPFTDRRQRMKRARLIMQSLGVTFDHEPRIDLSQYPNNWPELRRQYHKAA